VIPEPGAAVFTAADVPVLARTARLDIPADRHASVAEAHTARIQAARTIEAIVEDAVRESTFGDVPPATRFAPEVHARAVDGEGAW
jgi:hypothetical protein